MTYRSSIELYPDQEKALEPATKKDFGVIVAPPGSGKTIMGLELIARKQQPALIIVHRKQLFDQWIERIESFLGIPEKDIGKFSGSHKKHGKEITVGMIQTLKQNKESDKILDSFGTIIVDECHHIPAKTFRETIIRLSSYYLYGLTATTRNQLIVDDLTHVIDRKKAVLLLTERKSHIDVLNLYLKERFETITISGDDSDPKSQSDYDGFITNFLASFKLS